MDSMSMAQWDGPVVAVTGASAGVGRATAIAFARRGWRVGLLARGRDGLEGARRDVEEAGGEALVLPTDVADFAAVQEAADRIVQRWGRIDVWVNNAMATIFARFEDITAEEYRRATEVTYLGCVHGTMAALRRMRPRDRGTIVQVGSALSYRAIPLQAPYCGAKFAIRGFTDSLRSELVHEGSRVHLTMVQMPALNTPQFDWARNKTGWRPQPAGPVFQPELAAEAILFAAAARRREVWVGLSTIEAILGTRIAPGLLDRYLARTAYEGQMTDERERPGRADNLFAPLPGDFGAHGRFGRRARRHSAAFWATRHRKALALGMLAAAGVLGAWLAARRPLKALTRAQ
jgi:NAD(P)-dependent dehydrogenase (short-subunit alcohol dehydrogenase family)